MNLPEIIHRCLDHCQDDQAGLNSQDERVVGRVVGLFEEFEIYSLKELRQALVDSGSLYD